MNKNWKWLFLLIAIIGVILFRELPHYWNYIAWLPINIGFAGYYDKSIYAEEEE